MMQTLDPGTHTIIDPAQTDIKFSPIEIDGQHYQYWQELGRLYIRHHGEESACAGPFRTKEALDKWIRNPDREYKAASNGQRKGLPMSDDHKPIAIIPFITALRTSNTTAERVCGFTHSVVGGKHILRENGEDGYPIEDWEKFRSDDDYAQATVRDFLRLRNEARLREHVSRPARGLAPKGKVVNLSRRDYDNMRGPIIRSDNRGVYHWRGMQEADRRSQSAPGYLRWETIKVQPAPKLAVVKSDTPALKISDSRAWKHARQQAAALVAEANGRYNWKTGEIKPKDDRPPLDRLEEAYSYENMLAALREAFDSASFREKIRLDNPDDFATLGRGVKFRRTSMMKVKMYAPDTDTYLVGEWRDGGYRLYQNEARLEKPVTYFVAELQTAAQPPKRRIA